MVTETAGIAFYDLDGTLVRGNVVTRLAFLMRQRPSRLEALRGWLGVVLRGPYYVAVEHRSRRRFNELFYRRYRGLERAWLEGAAPALHERAVRPKLFADARRAVEADRRAGYRLTLVSGELDFAVAGLADELGFDHVVANRLVYRDGRATGEVVPPLIVAEEKPRAMLRLCRQVGAAPERSKAYSDSFSDVPMLAAVGQPVAVNPDARLRRVAVQHGWRVESWN